MATIDIIFTQETWDDFVEFIDYSDFGDKYEYIWWADHHPECFTRQLYTQGIIPIGYYDYSTITISGIDAESVAIELKLRYS